MDPVNVVLINEANLLQKFGDPLPAEIIELIECTLVSTTHRVYQLGENLNLAGHPKIYFTFEDESHFLTIEGQEPYNVKSKVPPKCED